MDFEETQRNKNTQHHLAQHSSTIFRLARFKKPGKSKTKL